MDNLSKYHFGTLKDGEKVLKIIHRHWFSIFQQFFLIFLVIVFLIAGFFTTLIFFGGLGKNFILIVIFLLTTFLILLWEYAFLIWLDYYYDIWIITSERIVNIEQKGLFLRRVSELNFSKIQDVTADVSGVFATLLNFGDVHIQTAAEEEKFRFRQISDPYAIKSFIMNLIKAKEEEKIKMTGGLNDKA